MDPSGGLNTGKIQMNKASDRGNARDVKETVRDGKWVFLCPRCPYPRTKTDDPEAPAMILVDNKWVCPKCQCWVLDSKLYGG